MTVIDSVSLTEMAPPYPFEHSQEVKVMLQIVRD